MEKVNYELRYKLACLASLDAEKLKPQKACLATLYAEKLECKKACLSTLYAEKFKRLLADFSKYATMYLETVKMPPPHP